MTRVETHSACDCDWLRESRAALLRENEALRESLHEERLSRATASLGSQEREATGRAPEPPPVTTGVGAGGGTPLLVLKRNPGSETE